MFITFGLATFLWGFVLLFFMPDTINGASFLTEEEKQYAEDRVVVAGLGRFDPVNAQWKPSQVLECFLDPKTYFFVAISICTQIPNGGTGSFGNLALKSFGFTSLQSTLVSLPSSVISMSVIMISGWLAGRYSNITSYLLIGIVIPPVVGSALIYSLKNKGVRLFAYYLLAFGPAAIPLALGLLSANTKGVTKKMTLTAVLFITYCAGNIAGPQLFLAREAKQGYPTAFRAILICYGLVMVIAIVLRLYLSWENKRRDRREGAAAALPVDGDVKRELTAEDYEDITDMQTPGFRYRM
ncbi:putative transporter-3 [Coleophoma cylindrospora]|uniref:Putative transporter-3 n=1 Tax=Coleophoma cylindrospora TaxID=1849047 RepID=A0A3D8QFC6_9HELO|nr:putative transporter-3 [Coleophoma cylindrospora]